MKRVVLKRGLLFCIEEGFILANFSRAIVFEEKLLTATEAMENHHIIRRC